MGKVKVSQRLPKMLKVQRIELCMAQFFRKWFLGYSFKFVLNRIVSLFLPFKNMYTKTMGFVFGRLVFTEKSNLNHNETPFFSLKILSWLKQPEKYSV